MDRDGDADVDGLYVLTGIEDIYEHYFSSVAELHDGFSDDFGGGDFGRCGGFWGDDEWAYWCDDG